MRTKEYDELKIKQIIEDFKSRNLKPSEITIYFDIDNTLGIFSYYGNDALALKKSQMKGFFRNIQCFEEAPYVIETLQNMGFNIKIITSCINTPYCKAEKLEWIKYYFPTIKETDIILIDNGQNKANYIENPEKSIIVDDFYANLMNCIDNGILAIKKTFSGKKRPIPQVENLTEIFGILFNLGVLSK